MNALPPSLSFGQPLRVDHVYQSTAQAQQRSCDILTTPPPPPPFKRAAGNWKVQYNLDTFHKVIHTYILHEGWMGGGGEEVL